MKSIKFKVSGHIVEKGLLLAVQEKMREWENCDVRDIHLYQPSLKASMDQKAPSIIEFYVTGPDDRIDELHRKILKFIEQKGLTVIHVEEKAEDW